MFPNSLRTTKESTSKFGKINQFPSKKWFLPNLPFFPICHLVEGDGGLGRGPATKQRSPTRQNCFFQRMLILMLLMLCIIVDAAADDDAVIAAAATAAAAGAVQVEISTLFNLL